jgi:hypothetical protein
LFIWEKKRQTKYKKRDAKPKLKPNPKPWNMLKRENVPSKDNSGDFTRAKKGKSQVLYIAYAKNTCQKTHRAVKILPSTDVVQPVTRRHNSLHEGSFRKKSGSIWARPLLHPASSDHRATCSTGIWFCAHQPWRWGISFTSLHITIQYCSIPFATNVQSVSGQ